MTAPEAATMKAITQRFPACSNAWRSSCRIPGDKEKRSIFSLGAGKKRNCRSHRILIPHREQG